MILFLFFFKIKQYKTSDTTIIKPADTIKLRYGFTKKTDDELKKNTIVV
jgi:hypothetical protein